MGDDVIRMQQEAAQRVQRMQERARRLVAESPPISPASPTDRQPADKRTAAAVEEARHARAGHTPTGQEAKTDMSAIRQPAQPHSAGKADTPSGLAALAGDQERLFILLLAILLVRNGAKMDLVLALLYLAM